MTEAPLQIAGQDVATFLLTRFRDLTNRVIATLVAEVAAYARLPDELLKRDVRQVVERAVRIFAGALDSAGKPESGVLADLTESAVRRAEEGVPFEMVLAAYHCGVRVCEDAVLEGAGPGDLDAVLRTNRAAMNFLEQVAGAVAEGYSRHARTTLAEQSAASQALVNALIDGVDIAAAARRAGVVLPAGYLVVNVRIGVHPDELVESKDSVVANRRKLRRVRDELDLHFSEPVLWFPSPDGGIALIPHGTVPEAINDPAWARLRKVVNDARRAAGASVHAGAVAASPHGVPEAVNRSREILELVVALERPEGLYRLLDVALEYQLTRDSDARRALASLVAPLADHRALVDTIRTFLATGLSRQDAAAQLHVHPNTIDNRLHRAAALTGLDASNPADLPRLGAALIAWTFETGPHAAGRRGSASGSGEAAAG